VQPKESFEQQDEKDLSRQLKQQLPPSDSYKSHGRYLLKDSPRGLHPRGVSLFRAKLVIPTDVPVERPDLDLAEVVSHRLYLRRL
jgi:hypothetical protein